MRAMILAAGRGERMRPLTDQTPKPMLLLKGKPLIQYHVEHLVQAGIVDIVINHAILGEQIEDYLGDGDQWGARIRYSPEHQEPLETAGGIVRALPLLGAAPFITVNADIWTDFPFQQLLELAKQGSGRLPHIILVDNPLHNPQGDFALRGEAVLNAGETMLTFSGISLFPPEFLKDCPAGRAPLTPMLRHAAAEGQLSGSHYQGCWHDIGTPERLQEIQDSSGNM